MMNLKTSVVRHFVKLILLLMSFAITNCFAHNKVVVVPMAGDDITPPPLAPLTAISPPNSDYILGALSVIDKITGLEWQTQDDDTTRTWDAAIAYCNGLDLDGKTDWVLPTVTKLGTIIDYNAASGPTINAVAFPSTNELKYWSASNVINDSAEAWCIGFAFGVTIADSKASSNYVRCVR